MRRRIALVAVAGGVVVAVAVGLWRRDRFAPAPSRALRAATAPIPRRPAPPAAAQSSFFPGSHVYRPRVRTDIVSVAGKDEPVPSPFDTGEASSGKPLIVDRPAPSPTNDELRADKQRRRSLREMGTDTPNPRLLRPNAPRSERPGPPPAP